MNFVFFLLNLLYCLPLRSMHNLPDDIFFNWIIPNISLPNKPLVRLSELSKKFDNKHLTEKMKKTQKKLANHYINIINHLSCDSWYANYLSKDIISLSLTSTLLYHKICTKYKEQVEKYRKEQLCICFKELGVWDAQHGIVQPEFNQYLGYIAKKIMYKNLQGSKR